MKTLLTLLCCLVVCHVTGYQIIDWSRVARPAPSYKVDLDEPPIKRWQHIAKNYDGQRISKWINDTINELIPDSKELVAALMELVAADIDDLFTKEQADEMRGLSEALKVKLYEVVLVNIVYDLTAFNSSRTRMCTSIVAEDKQGNMYHGRNLDYSGPAMMREMTIQIDFIKNGTTLFKSTSFVGYIGLITGVKFGKFSITGNERNTGNLVSHLISALSGGNLDFWHLRKVLEKAESYDEAFEMLKSVKITAPVYYIVGGSKPSQGAIIVRDPEKVAGVVQMRSEKEHPWFVLETNYDPWTRPPQDDDRRQAGLVAMSNVTQARINEETMYNVLSVIPVMNDETVYTTIMSPSNSSIYFTMIRYDAPAYKP